MFDSFRNIAAGFRGDFADNPQARKAYWLYVVTLIFSLTCTAFAAFVSYTRYVDLLGFAPYADLIGGLFTALIALFMFFAASLVSAYIIAKTSGDPPEASFPVVLLTFICAVSVGIYDYRMNISGAADVATIAAGTVAPVNYEEIRARYEAEIQADRASLEQLKAGQIGGYGWKNPASGTYHLNSSGKKYQRALSDNIERLTQARQAEIEKAERQYQAQDQRRLERETQTAGRLKGMVKAVYFVQFLLTLLASAIAAGMVGSIEEEREQPLTPSSPGPAGFKQGKAAPSTAELNRLRRENERLKQAQADREKNGSTVTVHSHSHSSTDGYEITCQHCGQTAVMKSPRAKYCSSNCRKEAYQLRTGKQLRV